MSDRNPGVFGNRKVKETNFLVFIVFFNLVIKIIPASIVELGNDEVYYWTYALFPDWSHFDHPPMVGLTIQFFTLNLAVNAEFFIRLGSLLLSSANIILLFKLVKRIYSLEAAYISSFLFTASIYLNVICGLFILPDTPQMFFVMLALMFGVPAITVNTYTKRDGVNLILFGIFTGLAMLSKYHSLFLWFGFGLDILFNDRGWLKRPSLYISILVTFIVMIPLIYWNIKNHFISFAFHSSRIGLFSSPVRPESFLQFNLGQIFYQNPVSFVVYVLTLVSLFRKGSTELTSTNKLLLYLSLPLILIFTLSALFKDTLPHWTGPAFIGLIILSSNWLCENLPVNRRKVLNTLIGANALIVLIVLLGILQINYGILYAPKKGEDPRKLGRDDVTLDMYGWRQAEIKFHHFLKQEGIEEKNYSKVKIISNNWFPAANLDFYIAHPLNIDLLVFGSLEQTHKYFWINKRRKINRGDKIYFIDSSQYYTDPEWLAGKFGRIVPRDTISIIRNGKTVKNLFVFEMMDSEKIMGSFQLDQKWHLQ